MSNYKRSCSPYTNGEHDVYYESNGNRTVPAGFENNSVKNRSASKPFAWAVATMEYNAALHFAPFAVLLNSQFFRQIANGRIASVPICPHIFLNSVLFENQH